MFSKVDVVTLFWVMIVLQVLVMAFAVFISFCYIKVKSIRESEYWTDYQHNDTIFRIYKWEFETQALDGMKRWQVLDRGDLTPNYRWILFTKSNDKRNRKTRSGGDVRRG